MWYIPEAMSGERSTRYTAPLLEIAVAHPETYDRPFKQGKPINITVVDQQTEREAISTYNSRLWTISVADEESQLSLFAQAISAVDSYPREKRLDHSPFFSMAYFTEPNGNRILFGQLEGTWDETGNAFVLDRVTILGYCDSTIEAARVMRGMKATNPTIPNIASDSFRSSLTEKTASYFR